MTSDPINVARRQRLPNVLSSSTSLLLSLPFSSFSMLVLLLIGCPLFFTKRTDVERGRGVIPQTPTHHRRNRARKPRNERSHAYDYDDVTAKTLFLIHYNLTQVSHQIRSLALEWSIYVFDRGFCRSCGHHKSLFTFSD